ncbi:MAG: hypothetical protein ABSC72_02455 [Methylovirgula sp.]|jgi:hypothetical protein
MAKNKKDLPALHQRLATERLVGFKTDKWADASAIRRLASKVGSKVGSKTFPGAAQSQS